MTGEKIVGVDPVSETQRRKLEELRKECSHRNDLSEQRFREMWKTIGKGSDAVRSITETITGSAQIRSAGKAIRDATSGESGQDVENSDGLKKIKELFGKKETNPVDEKPQESKRIVPDPNDGVVTIMPVPEKSVKQPYKKYNLSEAKKYIEDKLKKTCKTVHEDDKHFHFICN